MANTVDDNVAKFKAVIVEFIVDTISPQDLPQVLQALNELANSTTLEQAYLTMADEALQEFNLVLDPRR